MTKRQHTTDTDAVDFVLGEATPEHRQRLQSDPRFALEVAELRHLFEGMRELTVPTSQRVAVNVRYAVERRRRTRGLGKPPQVSSYFRSVLQVAAVAAVVLGGLLASRPLWQDRLAKSVGGGLQAELPRVTQPRLQPEPKLEPRHEAPQQALIEDPEVVKTDEGLRRQLDALPRWGREDVEGHEVTLWLAASNELDQLRRDFLHRISPSDRILALRRGGQRAELDIRIQDLAATVAQKSDQILAAAVEVPVQDISLALRALLAGGSRTRIGPHAATVRRLGQHLEERLDDLEGAELASALGGLMDLAVVTGRRMERLVGTHARRLAQSVFSKDSSLLNWKAHPAALADAGKVLQLAPAFGVAPYLAGRARRLLAAHLGARLETSKAESPELVAAQLYGFGDLVDRSGLDHRLLLWEARMLAEDDLVALHHVSWSRFPVRAGWTTFQGQLRGLAVLPTPRRVGDCSALLMCLAMNYAAPGSFTQVTAADADV